jgi:hypothetical protein
MGPRSRTSRDTSDPASLEVISPPHGRKPHEPTVWTASRRISTSTGSGLPGSATSWAASMGSSCRTYAHTHRTEPNLGRTCASLAGAKPDAYGSCTARRAERGSAERPKDRLAIDWARRRAGLIKLCTYRHLECRFPPSSSGISGATELGEFELKGIVSP